MNPDFPVFVRGTGFEPAATEVTGRSHEIAIRNAMGASRARLIRQMLIESTVLGLIGGVLGLLIASWGTRALVSLIPIGTIPAGLDITMNVEVLLFTLGISLVTAFIFGLWPAIQGSRTQTREALQLASQRATAGTGVRRAQSVLVVAEVSLSLILLVMAGLMIRSFAKLTNIDPRMSTANVMSMRINRSRAKSKDGSQNAIFFQNVIDRVKTVPGGEPVGVASHMPFVFKTGPSRSRASEIRFSVDQFVARGVDCVFDSGETSHESQSARGFKIRMNS